MGFVLVCAPPPICLLRVHSPMTLPPSFGLAPIGDQIAFRLVVSHHLDGLLRAEVLGLLRPKTDRGSLHFEIGTPLSRQPKPTFKWKCSTTPRNAVHTLRRIPLASSRTASPRPLPSCRSIRSPTAWAPKCSNRSTRAPTSRHRLLCLLSAEASSGFR